MLARFGQILIECVCYLCQLRQCDHLFCAYACLSVCLLAEYL